VTYTIEFSRCAAKELAALPKVEQKKIAKKIDKLANDPFPAGNKKLEGNGEIYRIRQGDYRILYAIQDKKLIVLVLKIGHRREVYR
jgi:mRNA interferase RelE/StbE